MRIKSFVLSAMLSLLATVAMANQHTHSAAGKDKDQAPQNAVAPGYCEIEIINDSYDDLRIYGVFDDRSTTSFNVYRYEMPHYISLYYNGYCHAGMDIYIDTFSGYRIYAAYTPTGNTIRIVPGLKGQSPKANITAKA